ncbi:thioredoxin [bacterium]|nr:thioredoxin [candidate division CSSED10-310 bacterium]
MTTKISKDQFDELVLKNSGTVVVDFGAEWCGPCKKLKPILENLSEKYKEKVAFVEIDVGVDPDIAQKYSVMSLPTLVFFSNGEAKDRLIGLTTQDKIIQKIDALI